MVQTKLHEILGQRRMKLAELQRLSGVSYGTLHSLYHNKTNGIEYSTLDGICGALDIQPGDLLKYSPDPPSEK